MTLFLYHFCLFGSSGMWFRRWCSSIRIGITTTYKNGE
nr:hypothetical protein TDPV-090 [Oriental turtle dovepox virus]